MATMTLGIASTPVTASKTWTGTDTDAQDILNWGAATFAGVLPANPTNVQIMGAIANDFMTQLKSKVQTFMTAPVVAPPLITMT